MRSHGSLMTIGTLLLALWACDDDVEVTETPTGGQNASRCIASAGGAAVCAGNVCYTNSPTDQIGICTEECATGCRFGGDCLQQPGLNRVCLQRCTTSVECGADATCQSLPGADHCTDAGCVPTGSTAYCIPLT